VKFRETKNGAGITVIRLRDGDWVRKVCLGGHAA
jgi:hypothetical protein